MMSGENASAALLLILSPTCPRKQEIRGLSKSLAVQYNKQIEQEYEIN